MAHVTPDGKYIDLTRELPLLCQRLNELITFFDQEGSTPINNKVASRIVRAALSVIESGYQDDRDIDLGTQTVTDGTSRTKITWRKYQPGCWYYGEASSGQEFILEEGWSLVPPTS